MSEKKTYSAKLMPLCAPNRNGRVYTTAAWENAMREANPRVEHRQMWVTIGIPPGGRVWTHYDLCGVVTKLGTDADGAASCEFELLDIDSELHKVVREFVEAGQYDARWFGTGSVDQKTGVVGSDFRLEGVAILGPGEGA